MSISTISNAKLFAIKMYFLNLQNKKVINKKFNQLHEKEKISQTKKFKRLRLFNFRNIKNRK